MGKNSKKRIKIRSIKKLKAPKHWLTIWADLMRDAPTDPKSPFIVSISGFEETETSITQSITVRMGVDIKDLTKQLESWQIQNISTDF